MHCYNKLQPVSLIQQKIALLSSYKESNCYIDKNILCWSAKLRPTQLSRTYQIRITYKLRESPKVWVIGEELEKLDAPDFPHTFEIDVEKKMVRICLCRRFEFSSFNYLANSIVPWSIEWLYHYEMWLATEIWHGGGIHPIVGKKKDDTRKK